MTTATNLDSSGWIPIFRAGNYGDKGEFTAADLDRVIRNYDPSFHEAPVVVGHPKSDAPAYAWIDRLMRDGDTLLAREKQVDPKFAEERKAGRFKKRSASFYLGADGKIASLRHVGWLGAQPPEVKGLRDVKFSDEGKEIAEVNFGEEDSVAAEKSVPDQIKEFFASVFGGGADNRAANFSESEVKNLVTSAVTLAIEPLQAKIDAQETKLTQQAASFAEPEGKLGSAELKSRAQEAVTRLKAKGKWVPAFDVMGGSLLFVELAGLTTTIEFGEGDAKKTLTPLAMFESFMEQLPAVVPTGTRVTASAAAGENVVDFGERADANSAQLHTLAKKRASEKSLSYGDALTQVAKENPGLTKAGNSSAGAV